MLRVLLSGCVVLASSAFCAPRVRADSLRIDATGEAMRVDGSLREWRGAHFAELGSEPGRSLRYALASSPDGLYVGAEVDDDRLVRGGKAEDALVLLLEDGAGKAVRSREVWLYPGEPGRNKALGAVAPAIGSPARAEPRVRVVEGPRSDGAGYVIEAFIPFDTLFGKDLWEAGHAALRFEDADGKGVVRIATSDARPLPHIALGDGQHDFFGSYAAAKGKPGIAPTLELRANLAGDARPERVGLIDTALVVYGAGVQNGMSFLYFQLPVESGAAVSELAPVDFDGDGTSELVVRFRQKNALGTRELYTVLSVTETAIRRVFAAEVKKVAGAESVTCGLALKEVARGEKRLELFAIAGQKASSANFAERAAEDVVPLLAPWGAVRARSYAYDGARFRELEELAQYAPSAASTPAPAVPAPTVSAPSVSAPAAPAATVAPSDADVLAHFKRAAKLPGAEAPSRVLRGNLRGAAQEESVYVFGNVLVALGPDIGNGRGYVAYGLPVDAAAVRYVGLADVTGDGAAELLVRVEQPLGGADGALRELLLVLRLGADQRFARALTREVTRRKGGSAIVNRVSTKGGVLVIEPGRAEGWDAAGYPYVDEGTGGAEPIALPWKARAVRYVLDGERLVAAP